MHRAQWPRKPRNRCNREGLDCTGVTCAYNNKVARKAMDLGDSASLHGCR